LACQLSYDWFIHPWCGSAARFAPGVGRAAHGRQIGVQVKIREPTEMATDRNLLFGAFALITGFIDPDRFSETCKLLSAQPDESVESVLRGRGWISADDEQHLGYLVQSYLHNHHENAGESLSGLPSDIRQSLAALENLHFRDTIASLDPEPGPAA